MACEELGCRKLSHRAWLQIIIIIVEHIFTVDKIESEETKTMCSTAIDDSCILQLYLQSMMESIAWK